MKKKKRDYQQVAFLLLWMIIEMWCETSRCDRCWCSISRHLVNFFRRGPGLPGVGHHYHEKYLEMVQVTSHKKRKIYWRCQPKVRGILSVVSASYHTLNFYCKITRQMLQSLCRTLKVSHFKKGKDGEKMKQENNRPFSASFIPYSFIFFFFWISPISIRFHQRWGGGGEKKKERHSTVLTSSYN